MKYITNNNVQYSVALLGTGATGKTSFVKKLCDNSTDKLELTIGIDAYFLNTDKGIARLIDTGGAERFKFTLEYFPLLNNLSGAILFTDATRYATVNELDYYFNMIKKKNKVDLPVILCMNKASNLSNAEKETYTSFLKNRIKDKDITELFFTDAVTGLNVKEAFKRLTDLL